LTLDMVLKMTERWLCVEEIATHLGVSKDTVYAWRDKKGLPAHRVGRFWKFKVIEVDNWVRSGSASDSSKGDSI
jgi:excisionase family DNA binding protein